MPPMRCRMQDECGVVRVILTQRSANLRNHAGEVALPGGKTDPEDTSPTATALREANEEVRHCKKKQKKYKKRSCSACRLYLR